MAVSERTKTTVNISDVSTTTEDMTSLYEWELGDPEPKGTQAKASIGMKKYREDLRNPPIQKDFYVDTLSLNKKTVAEQLKDR